MSSQAVQRAFVDRLNDHRAILFKVVSAYCGDKFDREDLAQEIVAALWRSYARFDERSSFSTWMYRVAVNVAISFLRSDTRKRRHVVPADASVLEAIPDAENPQTDERMNVLRDSIAALDPLDRALMLLYLDDCPHSEIASILGISESNVGTKVGRIKQRLRRELAGAPS
jgi:RNA polymerase sigma-70 factor, ECF subfamily